MCSSDDAPRVWAQGHDGRGERNVPCRPRRDSVDTPRGVDRCRRFAASGRCRAARVAGMQAAFRCKSENCHDLFPLHQLVLEATGVHLQCILGTHDAHGTIVFNDRDLPKAALLHEMQRMSKGLVRRSRPGFRRHDRIDPHALGIRSHGHPTERDVLFGADAPQALAGPSATSTVLIWCRRISSAIWLTVVAVGIAINFRSRLMVEMDRWGIVERLMASWVDGALRGSPRAGASRYGLLAAE